MYSIAPMLFVFIGRNIKEPEIRQLGAKWFRSANKQL